MALGYLSVSWVFPGFFPPPPTTIVFILAKGIRDTRWGNICLQLNGISAIIKYPLLLSLDCGSLPIQMEYEPHDYVSFQSSPNRWASLKLTKLIENPFHKFRHVDDKKQTHNS